ncbi:hypothetical protein sscle_13g094910 [Sclerotinia sclerotiorum 1980 UF-70]|uniref:Uncharacterized protein n=1 Tax=Sclerotinia sclerotiorum (strain ATCC 18683 / 1980 / Ss-1) TaxID=665079 RepID=A0A1D9QIK9_SCLS1|nr:hypothetical protein sscle_13g094910 [Sclerotinia sclerotiorum 1980 UF-70]
MSEKQTGEAAQSAAPVQGTTDDHLIKHDDHKSTSRPSCSIPNVAPVSMVLAWYMRTKEKADTAATSFKHHPSETPADHQHAPLDPEKGYYGNSSAETNARALEKVELLVEQKNQVEKMMIKTIIFLVCHWYF